VNQRVADAVALPDRRRHHRKHQRGHDGDGEEFDQTRRGANGDEAFSRDRQRQREERAAPRRRHQAAGTQQDGEQRAELSRLLLKPLRPDVAAVLARQQCDLANPASKLAAGVGRRQLRQQLHHAWIGEHDRKRGSGHQHETDQEPPPRVEPEFVPEHVSSPSQRFRGRSL
jgi:hypothetical protein